MNNLSDNGFMERPIGIVAKNYDFVEEHLLRNIGNGQFTFDGIGTPISQLADTSLNSKTTPWFFKDTSKNKYSNYLEYVGSIYTNGTLQPLNVESIEDRIKHFDINSLCLDCNKVGVIRNYGVGYATPLLNLVQNNASNPNAKTDTKLGLVNNFYLNATLMNSRNELWKKHSWGITPSLLDINQPQVFNVTNGAYKLFGYDGILGMSTGEYHQNDGMVRRNEDLTSHLNLKLHDGATFDVTTIMWSDNLIKASSTTTQEFIAKSMYGFDLLDTNHNVVFDSKDISNYSKITKKKYYATDGAHGRDYLTVMASAVGDEAYKGRLDLEFLDKGTNIPIRYKFLDLGNDNSQVSRTLLTYAEAEGKDPRVPLMGPRQSRSYNEGTNYGQYGTYAESSYLQNENDIISFTKKRFDLGKYDTLISRFHTNEYISADEARMLRNYLSSATSKYGMSHGRNLLRKKHDDNITNGYSNPYCRVWTYHHQYKSLADTIRPLQGESGEIHLENTELADLHINRARLSDYGVKMSNGLVRFAPTKDNSNIKRCMFSIENLAWKHERNAFNGYTEQRGPLGGRIMWFPPYDLNFNESVNVQWNSTQFIGRGENIYTYTNTERSGNLSFKILIDHPSILNYWKKKGSHGEINGIGDVDDVNSFEQSVLRFFAGCEPLEAKQEKEASVNKLDNNEKKQNEVTTSTEIPTPPMTSVKETEDVIYFYVFFPNNYTGVDDRKSELINPIHYLVNGVGAQLIYMPKDDNQPMQVDLNYTYGGYEVQKDGLSNVDTKNTESKYKDLLGEENDIDHGCYVCQNRVGGLNYWGYRVDKRVEKEVLRADNFNDTTCFGLNSTGYTALTDYHEEAKSYNEQDKLYSFTEMFVALEGGAPCLDDNMQYDELHVDTLVDIFQSEDDSWEVTKVKIGGFASSHGYTSSNNILNKNRAETIMHWLRSCNNMFQKDDLLEITSNEIGDVQKSTNVSDLIAKVYRCSKVEIHLKHKEEIIEPSTSNQPKNLDDKGVQQTNNVNVMNQQAHDKHIQSIEDEWRKKQEGWMLGRENNLEYMQRKQEQERLALSGQTVKEENGLAPKEYEFFEALEKNDPFMHHKITDKIKFFDPAFHSITPEGFNARLTFLHQCTRQGSTMGSSDRGGLSASNLAFGAPPICVLRIGDFYNTKILIESLQITYDETTWDLNDEGIGVMPMMADIQIGFKFLGGSDLSGPIARLQNAVSFNYYANTTVYDDRAEKIEYDENGNVIKLE